MAMPTSAKKSMTIVKITEVHIKGPEKDDRLTAYYGDNKEEQVQNSTYN